MKPRGPRTGREPPGRRPHDPLPAHAVRVVHPEALAAVRPLHVRPVIRTQPSNADHAPRHHRPVATKRALSAATGRETNVHPIHRLRSLRTLRKGVVRHDVAVPLKRGQHRGELAGWKPKDGDPRVLHRTAVLVVVLGVQRVDRIGASSARTSRGSVGTRAAAAAGSALVPPRGSHVPGVQRLRSAAEGPARVGRPAVAVRRARLGAARAAAEDAPAAARHGGSLAGAEE
mmetsp:Transcript_5418/g.24396  ORF Transcript_5418/g.24396 Transcript_5418/m.24396 type:complete len:230 (+) Transcript_5418:1107-1796(+)